MKFIPYTEQADKAIEILSKAAFLTTAHNGKTNTMTIGWGNIGFIWGKPIFTVMVRPSRYTYELIDNSTEFTVSIPLNNDMGKALGLCGSKSGRDVDKFAAAGLTTIPGQKVAVPVIKGCGLHYECKIVCKQKLDVSALDKDLAAKCYPNGDEHVIYYGEIVACYLED